MKRSTILILVLILAACSGGRSDPPAKLDNACSILKEKKQISYIEGSVVQRSRRYENDALSIVGPIRKSALGTRFANALEFVVGTRGVVAEFVRFIDDDVGPGFRWFELREDGRWESGVERLPEPAPRQDAPR